MQKPVIITELKICFALHAPVNDVYVFGFSITIYSLYSAWFLSLVTLCIAWLKKDICFTRKISDFLHRHSEEF